ncbi:hypothetical protein [Rossellomorea marisflavi]|uniref:hypothetical protein n=1 Tax=Rossellomorea marisflavi TaxID=189381 RepID=UPI003F9F81F2
MKIRYKVHPVTTVDTDESQERAGNRRGITASIKSKSGTGRVLTESIKSKMVAEPVQSASLTSSRRSRRGITASHRSSGRVKKSVVTYENMYSLIDDVGKANKATLKTLGKFK